MIDKKSILRLKALAKFTKEKTKNKIFTKFSHQKLLSEEEQYIEECIGNEKIFSKSKTAPLIELNYDETD